MNPIRTILQMIRTNDKPQLPPQQYQWNDYQEDTKSFVQFPSYGELQGIMYSALEVNDEAGEVAGKVKKIYRDHGGEISEEKANEILDELGDVLFGVSTLADQLGFKLEDVAVRNKVKLKDRKERNQISGEGDDR